jgi:hypothetical protein
MILFVKGGQLMLNMLKYLELSSILALAMGLCISMIAYLRLPSLKVSILLLLGLVVYDVFWVRLHLFSKTFQSCRAQFYYILYLSCIGLFFSVYI